MSLGKKENEEKRFSVDLLEILTQNVLPSSVNLFGRTVYFKILHGQGKLGLILVLLNTKHRALNYFFIIILKLNNTNL